MHLQPNSSTAWVKSLNHYVPLISFVTKRGLDQSRAYNTGRLCKMSTIPLPEIRMQLVVGLEQE